MLWRLPFQAVYHQVYNVIDYNNINVGVALDFM